MDDYKKINLHLTCAYKHIINKNRPKLKTDYILNVDKILTDKIECTSTILNRNQSFLLNYEIVKYLNKICKNDTNKYDDIIYVNKNLTSSSVINLYKMLNKSYNNIEFNYILYVSDLSDILDSIDNINKYTDDKIIIKYVN